MKEWLPWIPLIIFTLSLGYGVHKFAKNTNDEVLAERADHERRRDKECEKQLFLQCLDKARTPNTTHYTDQEETVSACERSAEHICLKGPK